MKEENKHIIKELEELKATNLASFQKSKLVIPDTLEEDLLAHLRQNRQVEKSSTVMRTLVRASMGIAATLVLTLLIWRPNLDQQMLSMDDLNEEELLYLLEHYLEDYDHSDLASLASNEASVFEFTSFEESYIEQEILDDVDISYDDLF